MSTPIVTGPPDPLVTPVVSPVVGPGTGTGTTAGTTTATGSVLGSGATGAELAVLARRELVSTPVGDLDTAVEVLERLNKLQVLGTFLQRGMEAMTSLRSSQFMILKAIEGDVDHPRHIGRKVGMETGAVELTLASLRDKGLVTTRSDRDHIVGSALTDPGRAILTQAEAMQIRATDALLQRADPGDVAEVLDLLDRAVDRVHTIIGLRPEDEDLASDAGATGC